MHDRPVQVHPLALAAALAAMSGGALAQDGGEVQEIIVTSSRVPTPLRQIGTSVAVITDEEIAAHGNQSLVDVLRQLPAMASSNNGGSGKATALRIRGEEGFRTLTIFDGIRLSDPSAPQVGPQIQHILSSGVGRVEILRGPQGLSYGADAGGVVNITSRRAEQGLLVNFDAQAGKFNTEQYSGDVSVGLGRFDFFLAGSRLDTGGFNTRLSDTTGDEDGNENTTLHGRAGVDITERLRFDVVHREVDADTEFDSCSFPTVHDCDADFELSATRVSLDYASENFSHSLAFATTDTDRENFAQGVSEFTADGKLNRLEYVGSATSLPGFDLVAGADWEKDKINGKGRDNFGVFGEFLSDFSDSFFLTAGVRYDDNDDFGTNTSFRFTGAYLIDLPYDSLLKFRGSYGTGFRAPSPFEIDFNAGPFAFPPASQVNLDREESEGWEAGAEYTLGSILHLEAVYFHQEVENAIFFDLSGFSGFLQDTGDSTSEGVELSAQAALPAGFEFTANYTYNDTERPNGMQRLRRPEHLANFGLSWSGLRDRLALNAFLRLSRDAVDEVFGTGIVDLEDFEVLDLSASFNITDNIQIYGRIENVLDEDFQEITDFRTPGRAGYIGFRLNFNAL